MNDLLSAVAGLIPLMAGLGITIIVVIFVVALILLYREIKEDQRYHLLVELVDAAEQMFKEPGQGKERRAWVMGKIEQYLPDLDLDLAADLIEAAVYRLNQDQPLVITEIAGEIETIEEGD